MTEQQQKKLNKIIFRSFVESDFQTISNFLVEIMETELSNNSLLWKALAKSMEATSVRLKKQDQAINAVLSRLEVLEFKLANESEYMEH